MDMPTNMRIVGSEMKHMEDLLAMLEPLLGSKPMISSRMEVTVDGMKTIITMTPQEIAVREEPGGRVVAQGDWLLAKAALAGMPPLPDPPPEG